MNAASHFLLLMCLMILPAGCRQEASTEGAPARGEAGVAAASEASGGAEISVPEQAALKETQAFLEGGGDANAKDELGSTRLTDAAVNDFGGVVTLLVSNGAAVDAVDDQLGQTALHFCASSDSARAAEALIQKGANVNAADHRGRTPLHEAAAAGSLGVLKVLLDHHADLKARDAAGKTPIDRALRARQQEAMSLLLAAGSEPAREPPRPPPSQAVATTSTAPPSSLVPLPPPAEKPAVASNETSVPPALTGAFPEKPFNGMQVEYRLEGANIESSQEVEDFTTSRTLTGRVTRATLRVSGRIGMGSGDRAEAHVRLKSGPSTVDLPMAWSAGAGSMNWREFDLSVPVASETATLAIEVIGTYNVGQRRLLLTGDFGPAAATATAHPPAEAPVRSPEIAAAGDLAEMALWWESQPWVTALKKSMPRGVRILMHAEPYDAEGWSEVELREDHAPDSGFDPNVSPMVGIFRVSRAGRKVEWMEPVSGEFLPVAEFIKQRNLAVATAPAGGMPGAGAVSKAPSVAAGDFESEPPATPDQTAPVIVKDPTDPGNHVAVITGPEARGFRMPATVAPGAEALTISLRLLHPESTKLIALADGRLPDGIRLRVQLLDSLGNSASGEAVVRPTGQWREMEFTLYDLPQAVIKCAVEASGMKGPIYLDDVRIAKPQ